MLMLADSRCDCIGDVARTDGAGRDELLGSRQRLMAQGQPATWFQGEYHQIKRYINPLPQMIL